VTAPAQEKLTYNENISLRKNINALQKKFSLSIDEICHNAGVINKNFAAYMASNFRPSGKLTPKTEKLKAYLDTFFIDGIPDNARTKDTTGDLYKIYGCAQCRYRYKSLNHDGCYKFSLTKEQINRGAWVETLKHGAFFLSERSKCPQAA